MRALRLVLASFAAVAGASLPAQAQLASGYSGQSGAPTHGVADDYWYLLRQIGPCVAQAKPVEAAAFLAATPASAQETRAFQKLFGRNSNVCMRNFVNATFVRAHMRGSIAEGLYERAAATAAPAPANGAKSDAVTFRTLHDFARCYIRGNSAAAASLLADTQLGSKEEADTVVGMAPGFKSCFPAGREVRIDATEVRMALAEALYHTARARPPES